MSAPVDFAAVVRAVFAASDKALGLGHTAEEHIQRTIAQLEADERSARALVAAFERIDSRKDDA